MTKARAFCDAKSDSGENMLCWDEYSTKRVRERHISTKKREPRSPQSRNDAGTVFFSVLRAAGALTAVEIAAYAQLTTDLYCEHTRCCMYVCD